MAGRSAAGPGRRPHERRLSSADADHVRELSAGASGSAAATDGGARRRDRARRHDPAARPTADLPGCVWLPGVRATRGPARTGSLHALRGRSAHRSDLPVHRLAVSELPVWPVVHAAQLRDRTVGTSGGAVGVQGDRRRLEPRCGRADRPRSQAAWAVSRVGGRIRRLEPGAAGAGHRRRAQRHADTAGARRRPVSECRRRTGGLPSTRSGGCAGSRRGDQGHGRAGAPLSDTRRTTRARARTRGASRVRSVARGRDHWRDRLRRARAGLPERHRRAAATGGDAQHSF
jgi:hypothetical protein